jgi:hypothetical protein
MVLILSWCRIRIGATTATPRRNSSQNTDAGECHQPVGYQQERRRFWRRLRGLRQIAPHDFASRVDSCDIGLVRTGDLDSGEHSVGVKKGANRGGSNHVAAVTDSPNDIVYGPRYIDSREDAVRIQEAIHEAKPSVREVHSYNLGHH